MIPEVQEYALRECKVLHVLHIALKPNRLFANQFIDKGVLKMRRKCWHAVCQKQYNALLIKNRSAEMVFTRRLERANGILKRQS